VPPSAVTLMPVGEGDRAALLALTIQIVAKRLRRFRRPGDRIH
jgi:hypothetical protein